MGVRMAEDYDPMPLITCLIWKLQWGVEVYVMVLCHGPVVLSDLPVVVVSVAIGGVFLRPPCRLLRCCVSPPGLSSDDILSRCFIL